MNVYRVIISAQEFEVEADDEADAMIEAQALIEIDSIELVDEGE